MRIVVINTAASEGGALSILNDFVSYIKKEEKTHEWIFILSENHLETEGNIEVMIKKNSKNKFIRIINDLYLGKKFIDKIKPDVVFSMQNTPIYGLDIPQLLYVHQPIPFQNIKKYSFFKREERNYAFIQHFLGKYIKIGLSIADKIVVQTCWMEKAVSNYTSNDKIVVIPPSINLKHSLSKTFSFNEFIYPTSNVPYKNIELIIKACKLINEKYPDLKYTVYLTTDTNYNIDNIKSIGKISRENVLNNISSKVLLFPSYIETYGLPLAEGRSLNTIILASDTVFSNELLNNYTNAYFFNPFKYEELVVLMLKCINGEMSKTSNKNSVIIESNQNTWRDICELIFNEVNYKK